MGLRRGYLGLVGWCWTELGLGWAGACWVAVGLLFDLKAANWNTGEQNIGFWTSKLTNQLEHREAVVW